MLAFAGVPGQPGVAKETSNRTLRVFNWNDYIDHSVIASFTQLKGVTVDYSEYDDNSVLAGRLTHGKSGYDVVVPSAMPWLARMAQQGLLQPLDKAKVPNLKNIAPELAKMVQTADPDNRYGVIYQWGTNGILYNADMVYARMPDAPVDSWGMVFDDTVAARFKDCGIAFIDSPNEVYPLVFQYLGIDPNTNSVSDLLKAEKVLIRVRPSIKYFHSSRYLDDLAAGRVCVVVGYSGDYIQSRDRAVQIGKVQNIAYSIPHEGTNVWFDMMAIPADAPNPDAAHAFINYILQPDVMAKISSFTGYANAVPASNPLVDREVLINPAIYPPAEVMGRLFTLKVPSLEFDRAMSVSWARMQAKLKNQ